MLQSSLRYVRNSGRSFALFFHLTIEQALEERAQRMVVAARRKHIEGIAHHLQGVGVSGAVERGFDSGGNLRLDAKNHRIIFLHTASERPAHARPVQKILFRPDITRDGMKRHLISIRPPSLGRSGRDVSHPSHHSHGIENLQIRSKVRVRKRRLRPYGSVRSAIKPVFLRNNNVHGEYRSAQIGSQGRDKASSPFLELPFRRRRGVGLFTQHFFGQLAHIEAFYLLAGAQL